MKPIAAYADGHEEDDPDVRIEDVGPEDRRDQDGDVDEDAAHRRRAGLLLVRLRTFLADELPELDAAHPLDQPRAEDEARSAAPSARRTPSGT